MAFLIAISHTEPPPRVISADVDAIGLSGLAVSERRQPAGMWLSSDSIVVDIAWRRTSKLAGSACGS